MADSRKLFEALMQENAHSLRVFLHSIARNPSLVDDLFQETMIVAWRTIDRFDQNRSQMVPGACKIAPRATDYP